MVSLEALKRIRALEFHLFGGMSKEEFYQRIPDRNYEKENQEVTGYIEMNTETGKITNYDSE